MSTRPDANATLTARIRACEALERILQRENEEEYTLVANANSQVNDVRSAAARIMVQLGSFGAQRSVEYGEDDRMN